MTSINTNFSALRAQLASKIAEQGFNQSVHRLTSGAKLNSGADDAAGSAVHTKLVREVDGVRSAINTASDMINALAIIDNAYEQLDDMLLRMRELAIQSANGIYADTDRQKMDTERAALLIEVNNITESTKFNSKKLLDGTFKDIPTQVGAHAVEQINVEIEKIEGIRLGRWWDLGFTNNDFSDATVTSTSGTTVNIPGWQIELSQVALKPDTNADGSVNDQIGGFTTPTDPTPTPSNGSQTSAGDDEAPTSAGSMSYSVDGEHSHLRLLSENLTVTGGDVTHGPYVISDNAVTLSAGDKVTFNWRAANGDDAFDVYAYLLETTTGNTIQLLDEMGAGTTDWAASETVVSTAGTYKFVFISGTYDYTHGTLSGASLYIDDVDVETANGPEVVVEYINVLDVESARTAIDVLNTANEQVATARAYVGALTNRVQSAINVLTTRKTEQEKAAGRIADADYARESERLAKMQILYKASNKMLAEANNMKNVLKLIQGN